MEVIWARASGLVRRGWRATVVLALLAGLAAGTATAMVAAGRRTASTYDRFAAVADVPELLISFCPPGVHLDDEEAAAACYRYDAERERQRMLELPEVEKVARGWLRGLTIAPVGEPNDRLMATGQAMADPGIAGTSGSYQLVRGRDATGPTEIVVNEEVERNGIGVGDSALLTFWSAEELGRFVEDTELHGPQVEVRIVGVVRALTDITQTGAESDPGVAPFAYINTDLTAATPTASGFAGVLVDATDDDADAATRAIRSALPDQDYTLTPALGRDETAPVRSAIRYEAQAIMLLGLAVAGVLAAFLVQVLVRQSRREWSDGPILRTLGVTQRTAATAAVLRGAAIALPAAAIALATAVLLSPLSPVGVARRSEVDPGVDVDLLALAVGALVLLLVVLVSVAAPVLTGGTLRTTPPSPRRERPSRGPSLPPVATAGLRLDRHGRGAGLETRTALVGVGAAVVVGIAAVTLAASLDDLTSTPARFGAPWDVSVGSNELQAGAVPTLDQAGLLEPVVRAANLTGTDMQLDGEVAWVLAYVPVETETGTALPVVPLPVSEGRPPATANEIAVGSHTLDDLALGIGDTVTLTPVTQGERYELEIVGEAIINDTFEASPGRGALVTPELIAKAAPEASADPVVLELERGADVDAYRRAVADAYDGPVNAPVAQLAVRNVHDLRDLPFAMAATVAVLALASLVHALVLSVSRNRRAIGVLRAIGFTRAQVRGAIAAHATWFAALALVVAVPLGTIVGLWGWQLVAEGLGVPVVPVVPVLAVAAVALGWLLLANLAAAYPAWRAGHLSTSTALRSE